MFIQYKFGDLKLCILVDLIMTAMFVALNLVKEEYYERIINIGSAAGVFAAAAAMFFMIRSASRTDNSVSE